MALILKVEVDSIYIYPFGGISKFKMPLNIHPIKELFILVTGPLFQIIAYYVLVFLMPQYKEIIKIYHIGILYFNLLPIYPLDGGKLLALILELFIPYKSSLKLTIYISYLIVIIIMIPSKITLNLIIMGIFLLFTITKEHKKIKYIYNKFILERYLNNYRFKKSRIINNYYSFYRNKRHLIKENNNYYLEKEYIKKIYNKV